jgi:hypothetical protein
MLIKKQYTTGDVVSIKLINGDELIARFDAEDTETVTISKPLAIMAGNQGLGMIPWVFLSNSETYTLKKSHIFVVVTAKKDAADQYMQGTTGIALA